MVLSSGLVISCATAPVSGVPHCITLEEWRGKYEVAVQHDMIDGLGIAVDFLDRYDYLSSVCIASNASRGDK